MIWKKFGYMIILSGIILLCFVQNFQGDSSIEESRDHPSEIEQVNNSYMAPRGDYMYQSVELLIMDQDRSKIGHKDHFTKQSMDADIQHEQEVIASQILVSKEATLESEEIVLVPEETVLESEEAVLESEEAVLKSEEAELKSKETASEPKETVLESKETELVSKVTLSETKETALVSDEKLIEVSNDMAIENDIQQAFEQLLQEEQGEFLLIPEGTRINEVLVLDGDMFLDFSEEILNYGGNQWEYELTNKLLAIAFLNDAICNVTITINKQTKNFVEGTIINRYTRENWNERNY